MEIQEEKVVQKDTDSEEVFSFFSVLTFILSIYVLVVLALSTFYKFSEELITLLNYIDNVICVVFLYDFIVRYKESENKLGFLKWGWIDLLSSIPMVDYFRAGRILRIVKLLRIFRAFRSVNSLVGQLYTNRVKGTFSTVAITAVLIVIFSSIAILQVETDPNSNIKTAEDAIWWSYTTMTTVGYGDRYPITSEGRIIAAFLMTTGVGLFGTFTALLSSWFLKEKK